MKTIQSSQRLHFPLLPFCLSCFLGCSDSDATQKQVNSEEVCEAAYQRDEKCDSLYDATKTEYMETCIERADCYNAVLLPEYVSAYWSCANERACDAHDDDCGASIMASRYSEPDRKARVDACAKKYETCEGSFMDDYCSTLLVVKDSLVDDFDACFSEPCDEVATCLQEWSTAHECSE